MSSLKPKPTSMPAASLLTPSIQSNRILDPIVRSVYESLSLRDPDGADRYLEAHLYRSPAGNQSASNR